MLEVIIVDDDQIVVFIQKKMITNFEIASHPISFNLAQAALEHIIKDRQSDLEKDYLILLDINMPHMDGWDFLDCLESHEKKSNYHVIMVTSSIDRKDKEKAKKYSTVRYFIEKPISAQDCEKIKEISEISHFFERV
ncbi:CheY-like chemotaxis protein [Salegentibacter sp. 24]|jgi:CheY-like chemotaxis protein|uniref:response regulator n=1 Tax=Salegentibacter sp. 24 TaxID=2183986 RepID=UPI00105DD638|nr:response regulator [Salegentibacter sp. 24]TDN82154.1 CheY-like chemotaxis protein [Salegentibacter sp. 24]